MAEPDPNPIEPSDDGALDGVDEAEVERVLAEAANLSTQLETEIGTPEPEPGSMADLAAFDEAPAMSDVDAQLEQVQGMLADVSESTADSLPPDTVEAPDNPPVETSDRPMKAPADWGFNPESEPPDPSENLLGESESESEVEPTPEPQPHESHVRRLTAKSRTLLIEAHRTASRAATPAIEHTLRAADAVDGVFAFVRFDIRRILGWVALAIFVAAAAIAAYSLAA